jgi:ANTAR domain-containing protein/GAF domain-containing protein
LDAFATGRLVLVSDLTDGHAARWPSYASAVLERGIRAVFAFPIQVGGCRLGVMDVFRQRTGALTPGQVSRAVTFAEIALVMVLDGQERAPAGAAPQGFDRAPGFRAEIAQAQGMIMVQLGVTITEALVRLRAYSYAEGRPVDEVARDVVARRLRFDEVAP